MPPENSGFDSLNSWCPDRRPAGQNIALTCKPAIDCYEARNILNGFTRPYIQTNAWVADLNDPAPFLECEWDEEKLVSSITLFLILILTIRLNHPKWAILNTESLSALRSTGF